MNRLGFNCTTCHHRLAVAADRAGKAVRCPKCRAVMLAPVASLPASGGTPIPTPPDLSGAAGQVAEVDSIFSDPADGDGESLFDDGPAPRKPLFPSPVDSTQATLRVPGVPAPLQSPAPFTPLPIPQPPSGSRTAIDPFASAPTLPAAIPASAATPAETTNPFRRMVDEVMSDVHEQDEADAEADDRDREVEEPHPAAGAWKTWALVAVSVYALLATAAAVWGWTRTPPDKPAVAPVKK